VTAPYDHEALWIKAKLFINRAMDDDFRSFDEQALWAALALELLAKAALARVSPLLVAEPNEDGTNLLIASGLIAGDARFTSVRAKTLFARCHKAFRPFDQTEAIKIINGRNEYLHSSGTGFMAIPPNQWWASFWAQAAVLITALDKDITGLVGPDREGVVTAHLEQNAKNIEHRAQALIERARQRLQQQLEGTLPAKVAAEWKTVINLRAHLAYGESVQCPACGSDGLLEGNEITHTQVEGYEVFLTVSAEFFSCPACRLVLNSAKLVKQAGLPETLDAEGDPDDFFEREPEYGND
jgi:hypothetical protein